MFFFFSNKLGCMGPMLLSVSSTLKMSFPVLQQLSQAY